MRSLRIGPAAAVVALDLNRRPPMRASLLALGLSLLAPGATAPAWPQSTPAVSPDTPDRYPPALPPRQGPPPPSVRLTPGAELELPGSLARRGLVLHDGVLYVVLREGAYVVRPTDPPTLEPRPLEPEAARVLDEPGDASPWVYSEDGCMRYRSVRNVGVEAQRRRRCPDGTRWKHRWRLRLLSANAAPPLLTGPRLIFGALDNRVYALRADNGHRLWDADVGGRISTPLALWTGRPEGAPPGTWSWVVVVPDDGARMALLDVYNGLTAAEATPEPARERLVPPPVALLDGRLVVGLQRYEQETRSILRTYRLAAVPAEAVTYNGLRPPELKPARRRPEGGFRGSATEDRGSGTRRAGPEGAPRAVPDHASLAPGG